MAKKIEGKARFEFKGLEIYVVDKPAKRDGLDRVWIQIRQKNPKPWRMAATLAYPHALDVRFERPQKDRPTHI